MDKYVTGAMIKRLREEKGLTQLQLAERLNVSDKTVSKWETARGYPDVTLLEPLAGALDVSMIELLSGSDVRNRNRSADLLRTRFYVCPVCGNLIQSTGDSVVSCCGITLPPLEAEEPDEAHRIRLEPVEDEYFVSVDHAMTKDHFISFFAAVSENTVQLVKLYPEGPAEARFKMDRVRRIYCCCGRHGLFGQKVR